MFGTADNFDIIINIDKGDFEIWRNREVVEDDKVEDPNLQIALSQAKKIDKDYEVGEDVTDEVKLAISAEEQSWRSDRILHPVYSTLKRIMYMKNTGIK